MDIGIGLPVAVPGTDGATIVEWAQAAEEVGFSSIGVLDRIVYDNYDPIAVLGAAAAVTDIRLLGAVLLVPLRGSGAVVAKQLASVDRLSLGRLTVAVVTGDREDDYIASGTDFERRGHDHDRMLVEMHQTWQGVAAGVTGTIGPLPAQRGGPPVLVGGYGPAAIRRVVRHGAGWIWAAGGRRRSAVRRTTFVGTGPRPAGGGALPGGDRLLRARRARHLRRPPVPHRLLRLPRRGRGRDHRRGGAHRHRHPEACSSTDTPTRGVTSWCSFPAPPILTRSTCSPAPR